MNLFGRKQEVEVEQVVEPSEPSQTIYEALKALEATFPKILEAESAAVEDQKTRDEVISLLTAERLLNCNDQRVRQLQTTLLEKSKAIRAPRETYQRERARLIREMEGLTRPAIDAAIEKISDVKRKGKLSEEVIEKRYVGISQTNFYTLKTNRPQLLRLQEVVEKGIASLRGMSLKPVTEIQKEVDELEETIARIDWKKLKTVEMTETDYRRATFV